MSTDLAPPVDARAGVPVGPRDSKGYRLFTGLNATALVLITLLILYPFVTLLAQSFSSSGAIKAGLVNALPVGFNLETYRVVAGDDRFWTSYGNTVLYTVVGTVIAMVLTTTFAYAISKPHLRGRNALIGIAVFTMFFNGGIIPNYVLISSLGMKNTMWALVLPGALSVFNLLVMKSFFENIPRELEEAAQIDGLGWFAIFTRIVLPLSKAVIATMILFYSVAYWNDWFTAFLYLDEDNLFPLSLFLRNLIAGATTTTAASAAAAGTTSSAISANIQAVTMILAIIPILCVYPFVQRHFVSGVMLGSVKG
ncbi:putative aldouronate transport system permease protein [Cellulomonas humilata]|uniref:Aldouronate transport system permease protein n=1 Tax=Cellulomonas humilata TaxID=144055 RepID=A0ABU0EGG9_9CELL|nr:carbohydrate ABC transporter permease [Cellulomonas humilata]MDQ0374198.1 putative aldouronate transport system permease protein [Cellulomonas humilata]